MCHTPVTLIKLTYLLTYSVAANHLDFISTKGKYPQIYFDANLCKSWPLLIVCFHLSYVFSCVCSLFCQFNLESKTHTLKKRFSVVKNNLWNQCVAMHIIREMQQLRKVVDWDGPNMRSLQKAFSLSCTNLIIDLIHNSPLYSYKMDFPILWKFYCRRGNKNGQVWILSVSEINEVFPKLCI